MKAKICNLLILLVVVFYSCNNDDGVSDQDPNPNPNPNFNIGSFDSTIQAPFGDLDYRVYYPEGFSGETFVIHVSRGGNGIGDDRGQLTAYVDAYVQEGYVVMQIDHRLAGNDIETIARYRGEEIQFIAQQIVEGTIDYGDFQGTIDVEKQGFSGHSGGCMEGLMAAGTVMTHGNYKVPQIKAVYGMSPAGYDPDQFGIAQNPNGYAQIEGTAVFLIIGEAEKDINGPGTFMAEDWRLQAFDAMVADGMKCQILVRGNNTDHLDVKGENPGIEEFNIANSVAMFETYLRGNDRSQELGNLALPGSNEIEVSKK
ncbi:hypothetical protein GTQ34_15970 [Muricauda sp. JGD-17]|uniref:Alpha/beta hydrolase n=1 Tax=Flagellimonas ochracea TaxID=2696472 RepID=A0A964TFM1_9FLAO|nr:hypothetical protein [Allomuricauda ochracea]NAY93408.1 hypothetical protein [Allomuricauda ochracea]